MLNNQDYSALEILHQNESFIYEEFATESIDNIHVKSIDLNNPLASILRVALSDIISSQILASKKESASKSESLNLRVYPVALYIVDKNSKKFSRIILNSDNCNIKKYLLDDHDDPENEANNFREELFSNDLLTLCSNNYHFKDRGYFLKKSELIKELTTDIIKKSCFSNLYSNTKYESRIKSKNKVNYKVYVLYDIYKRDNQKYSFEISNSIGDDFINHFLKKIFVLAISTKRNKEFYTRIKSTTLKSSLAAVMSRNMSHNIGSHVLNKLSSGDAIKDFFALKRSYRFVQGKEIGGDKTFNFPDLSITSEDLNTNVSCGEIKIKTPLEQYNQKLKDDPKFLEQYDFHTYIGETEIYKLSPYFVDVNNNTTKEELARVFNDYLKKRMDFVADVATSNKALLSNSKYLFADIFRGFERNLLLLQNISGKEDKFSYEFQFQYCDGETDEHGNLITTNYYIVGENNVLKKNPKFIDPIVAVPNDVLGSQAFYIILENIIRNTAKHSGSGNVVFTIKVEDLREDDFYRVTVYDNVAFTSEDEDLIRYKNVYTEQDNDDLQKSKVRAHKLRKLVVDRNISIAQEVLDENNEIRTAGWGTIEIKLAACYLSGLDMLEMDNKRYWPVGYPAYTKAEKEAKEKVNTLKEGELLDESNPDISPDDFIKREAFNAYVGFIENKNPETKNYNIPKENSKEEIKVIDCNRTLKRTYHNRKNNKVTRYPIVQAVDGSVATGSGFGYSFLMKKPKKLLIIDEGETLKLEMQDTYDANFTALKRLGIDIIEKPDASTIYNHQFMIIVGDGEIKEITTDENDKKIIPYYGDWFNLPQERFRYLNKAYENFQFCLMENQYGIKTGNYSGKALNKILVQTLKMSSEQGYPNFEILSEVLDKTHKIKLANREKKLFPLINRPFNYTTPSGDENFYAYFKHHGMEQDKFFSETTEYAEIYGSVTALGLFSESIESEILRGKTIRALKKQHFCFYNLAANTSVMVIDERIQSVLGEVGLTTEAYTYKDQNHNDVIEKGFPITNDDLFKKTKIFIPSENKDKISLNNSDLKTEKNNLKKYIEKISEKKNIDYLIIHFGIIEGLRDSNSVSAILNEIKSWIKSPYCKIVITSGRGHTPDIKNLKQFFVSYSTISNLLIDPNGRSKGHLVQCLKQLRI